MLRRSMLLRNRGGERGHCEITFLWMQIRTVKQSWETAFGMRVIENVAVTMSRTIMNAGSSLLPNPKHLENGWLRKWVNGKYIYSSALADRFSLNFKSVFLSFIRENQEMMITSGFVQVFLSSCLKYPLQVRVGVMRVTLIVRRKTNTSGRSSR